MKLTIVLFIICHSSYYDLLLIKTSLKIPKRVIRSCKSKKDRQCNCQRKRTKRQTMVRKHYTEKLNTEQHDPLIKPVELGCSGKDSSSCSTSATRRVSVKRHQHHRIWTSCWTPVCVNEYKSPEIKYKPSTKLANRGDTCKKFYNNNKINKQTQNKKQKRNKKQPPPPPKKNSRGKTTPCFLS